MYTCMYVKGEEEEGEEGKTSEMHMGKKIDSFVLVNCNIII